MMFQLHTAYATELIALAAGIALMVWVSQKEVKCAAAAKIASYFILVAVVLSMLCTLYYGIRYWEEGHFRTPYGPPPAMGAGGMGMMQGKKCPMMEEMMGGMMGGKTAEEKGPETQPSKEGHEAHHPQ